MIATIVMMVMTASLLVGCGTSFEITREDLQAYAEEHDMVYDEHGKYAGSQYVEDHCLICGNGSVDASIWFYDVTDVNVAKNMYNIETSDLIDSEYVKSYESSSNSSGGDFSCMFNSSYNHILFSNDKVIIARGDQEDVDSILSDLGIIE